MILVLFLLTGFVQAQGADLSCEGRLFRFVGANLRVMHGEVGRGHYQQIVAAAAHDGLRVGRVWALGEGAEDATAWQRRWDLFRVGPDGWIEDAYLQLDRVLAEAQKRGLRLIVTLSNSWKDFGGAPQYLRWLGQDDLDSVFGAYDRFYDEPRARQAFAAHVERLLARTNSIDGTRYVDDPTIMAWELMNESQVASRPATLRRRDWIAWASALIKARDRNHLVGPGLIGYHYTEEREDWIETHRLPGVDYCDAHLYPQQDAHMRSLDALDRVIDDHAQLARYVVGKPLVLGEFGIPTRVARFQGAAPTRWFERLLARARLDGIAGTLAWIYQSRADYADDYPIWVDAPAHAPVRQVLQRAAAAMDRVVATGGPPVRNPRLGPDKAREPLYSLQVDLPGRQAPLRSWEPAGESGQVLRVEPDAFALGRWESVGVWALGALVHAYGGGTGFFEYHFRRPAAAPAGAPAALELRLRLSSEYPKELSPPDGSSRVAVLLDGRLVATLDAFPDDGRGRWYTIRVEDQSALAELAAAAVHTLRLAVAPGDAAHGLCIYGRAGKRGGVADAGPGELRWIN
jgi:mannan endo-1,4-beta-mannosidase